MFWVLREVIKFLEDVNNSSSKRRGTGAPSRGREGRMIGDLAATYPFD
jgi:hypothetical protein